MNMRKVHISFLAVVVLLAFAVAADLGAVMLPASFTADAYYLPLREVPVGDSRDAIERSLIETHGRVLRHQRRLWLVVHGAALACALVAWVGTSRMPPHNPPMQRTAAASSGAVE